MTNQNDFELALDDRPEDWNLRLIYADWLEENGFLEEAIWKKFLVEHKKAPHFRGHLKSLKWGWHNKTCSVQGDESSILPYIVVKTISSCKSDICHARFKTRIEAEKALQDYHRETLVKSFVP